MFKKSLDVLGMLVVGYLGFFFLWLMLATACVAQYERCGDDVMTKIVRVIYPINFLR
jgi:hypothetical protein